MFTIQMQDIKVLTGSGETNYKHYHSYLNNDKMEPNEKGRDNIKTHRHSINLMKRLN